MPSRVSFPRRNLSMRMAITCSLGVQRRILESSSRERRFILAQCLHHHPTRIRSSEIDPLVDCADGHIHTSERDRLDGAMQHKPFQGGKLRLGPKLQLFPSGRSRPRGRRSARVCGFSYGPACGSSPAPPQQTVGLKPHQSLVVPVGNPEMLRHQKPLHAKYEKEAALSQFYHTSSIPRSQAGN